MSEDRLEKALQAMQEEDADARTIEAARARVWETLSGAGGATCAEFRPDFRAYLGAGLAESRRVLLEDHLSRCTTCRAALADMKGERRVIPMPQRARAARSSRFVRWGSLAAAAALVLSVGYLGRGTIDAMMAPGGPRASVVSAVGGLYSLPEGALAAGAAIGEKEPIRTGPGAHAVLRLADGSMVDVNERTELFVTAAWSGQAIHLQRGDVIVKAAKQRRGHLRVLTRDSVASVKGTVFAVSAGLGGSVVSVVEGSVEVNQPGQEVLLSPGEQAASNPALAGSVEDAVSWSPDAEEYVALLRSLVTIERQLADTLPRDMRTGSALLQHLPAGAFVYGAVPNLGGAIGQTLVLAGQQSAENAAFGAFWNSEAGLQLRQVVDRIQAVSSLLGDEIVFCASGAADTAVPMVVARVQPGKAAELTGVLNGLFAEAARAADAGAPIAPTFWIANDLLVASNSTSNLAWAIANLGTGAGSPFAAAIADRYARGVGWLVGIDAAPIVAMGANDDAPPVELAGMMGVKYVFLEQRAPAGVEENEVTVAFGGDRTGMASWLADSGSGGAAEYLPADALVAAQAATREPWQMFGELTALATKENADLPGAIAQADEKLGAGFVENLTRAMGTESAFALTGFSVEGPVWVMAALANDPATIDSSLQRLAELANEELASEGRPERIVLAQESAGGRTWTTLKAGTLPFGVTWTYDRGYMVAASDRASAERAIATRNGGSPLVWSPEFVAQIPASAGIHPSAFAWINTKGALGLFSALAPNPAIAELLKERDPVLVVVNATTEQIHAASRSRLTKLVVDLMLLQGLDETRQVPSGDTIGQ